MHQYRLPDDVVEYTRRTVERLRVRTGPVHVQLKKDARGTIRLIEVNCRLPGLWGFFRPTMGRAFGDDIVTAVADTIFAPRAVLDRPICAPLVVPTSVCFLAAPRAGRLRRCCFAGPRTMVGRPLLPADGTLVARTVDMATMLGVVVLASARLDDVVEDHARVRDVFVVEDAPGEEAAPGIDIFVPA